MLFLLLLIPAFHQLLLSPLVILFFVKDPVLLLMIKVLMVLQVGTGHFREELLQRQPPKTRW